MHACAGFGTSWTLFGQIESNTGKGDFQLKHPKYLRRVLRDSIRLYFAPLIGAYKGIRAELHRADRQVQRNRHFESQSKNKRAHHA